MKSLASNSAMKSLQSRWLDLPQRDKNGSVFAALLLLGFVLWTLLISPAISTIRESGAQARSFDAQLTKMRAMQQQAVAIQKQPPQKYDDAVRTLTAATNKLLGASAKLVVTGDRANITLQDTPADGLAQWLIDARLSAKSVPVDVRLTRSLQAGAVRWNGVVVMSLPAK